MYEMKLYAYCLAIETLITVIITADLIEYDFSSILGTLTAIST